MAKKIKAVAPRRRTCTIEDKSGSGRHIDVLRFAEDRKGEHGTTANAICVAVRQSENYRGWIEELDYKRAADRKAGRR